MPPLTRQRTPESILSWWSDSNPPGATIDLHAASKPLMKFLYHRQVLGFMKRNHGTPLSEETVQICSDYLAYEILRSSESLVEQSFRFKYLLPSTKATILRELSIRTLRSKEDALAVLHSPVVNQLADLLQSPDSQIRRWTCRILGNLIGQESIASTILELKPCVQLVHLLRRVPPVSHDGGADVNTGTQMKML